MGDKDAYRKYEQVVEWCSMCPAHHCIKVSMFTKCRCDVLDRVIPEKYQFEDFPSFCPLLECGRNGRVLKKVKE